MSLVNVLGEKEMKKIVIFLVLAALITGGAFAQMSFGGGVLLDMSFGNGAKWKVGNTEYKSNTNNTSFGGFVFFDANYVEVDVSFAYGSLRHVISPSIAGNDRNDNGGNVLQLGFSVLGKYPIHLGSLTVFPLVGINYNAVLSAKGPGLNKFESKYPDPADPKKDISVMSESSQFGILGGIGLDVPFSNNLFFRAEALINLRFANKSTKEGVDDLNTPAMKLFGYSDAKTTLGIGPRIKIGIGFRF